MQTSIQIESSKINLLIQWGHLDCSRRVHVVLEEVRASDALSVEEEDVKRNVVGDVWLSTAGSLSMSQPSPKSSFGFSNGADMMEMWWSRSLSVGFCCTIILSIQVECWVASFSLQVEFWVFYIFCPFL
ncbi:hypothetical protein CsSME_00014190 [Camellia sinensis var. sinensis]